MRWAPSLFLRSVALPERVAQLGVRLCSVASVATQPPRICALFQALATRLARLISLALMLLARRRGVLVHAHRRGKRLHLTSFNPWIPGPYVPLVGNVRNTSGITPEELQRAVVRGLRMWQAASVNAFSFDYWQGSDTRRLSRSA